MRPSRPEARLALCRLPAPAMLPLLLARLPAALRPEVARFRRPEDQVARATARLLLRWLLADAGLEALADLRGWARDARGRPMLAGGGADFSISHAGGWAGVALGRSLRLGLDLEPWQPVDPADHGGWLTDAERAGIHAAADPGRALLRRWCLREAVLKADGRGFALDPGAIRAIGDGRFPDNRAWTAELLDWPHGALAVASDRPVAWLRAEPDAAAVMEACPPLG